MKNVRLKDIAKRLNLTKVSISKALRDHPDISVETREKVKEMAQEMGYRPNLQARSLASSKSKIVGVIVPKIAHSFFSSVIEGVYRTAADSGYEVVIGISFESAELEKKQIESMLNLRVDGLLVSVSEQTEPAGIFDEVQDMDINLVFFDRGFQDFGVSYVKVADRQSAQKGVRHLIELGHRNIAHLGGYNTISIGRDRELGYRDAMGEARLEISESAVIEGGFSEKDGYRNFEQLVKQHGQPEALFAVSYPVGLGALKKMKEMEIAPEKITILTFGGSEFNPYLSTPFICIDQPTFDLGKSAFELLLAEMESREKVKPQLIELTAGLAEKVPSSYWDC